MSRDDRGREPDEWEQVVLVDDLLHVVEDLGLRRVGAGPVGLDLEGERVQVRLHIARGAGIAIVVPRTADALGLLVQRDLVEPSLT